MRLQVLAVLENGASKIFPKGSDTLRVLLILPEQTGGQTADGQEGQRRLPASPVRRRVMASLAGESG